VDEARSKDIRGTGLGLSIVKHLMRLHGGRVELASELGVGTRVTLIFEDQD
jgi:two-component system phosphate regulon sensor histidine kinase PhoR